MSKLHRFTHLMHLLEVWIFNNPRKVLSLIAILTLVFALRIPGLKIFTDFADLLPQQHPYIELHNSIKDSFGGANVLVVGVGSTPFPRTVIKRCKASDPERQLYVAFSDYGTARCNRIYRPLHHPGFDSGGGEHALA